MVPFITAVVLAAGKGTRMKSDKAKVLHEVFFKPMVHHVLDSIQQIPVQQSIVIVGHQQERVASSLKEYEYIPVTQQEQLGTGHAVLCTETACTNAEQVMILCGDTPLVRPEMLQALLEQHLDTDATLTLLTTSLDNPFGYGRIVKDALHDVVEIVEQKDATPEQQKICEINAGIYVVKKDFLFSALHQVGTDNSQGEVYLTDIVSIAVNSGHKVHNFSHPEAIDVLGVNSRVELALAHQELQKRCNHEFMLTGITMLFPDTTLIAPTCSIGGDCILYPGIQLTGKTSLGRGCIVNTGAVLHDCTVADSAVIGAHAVLENCSIDQNERIPPLVHRVG